MKRLISLLVLFVLSFALAPKMALAQTTAQKVAGGIGGGVAIVQQIRQMVRGSSAPKIRVQADVPAADQIRGPNYAGRCDPGLTKITVKYKEQNVAWGSVLTRLGPGFKKRGWCYVVPQVADNTTYRFDLEVHQDPQTYTNRGVGGYLPGIVGSASQQGYRVEQLYQVSLVIYAPDGSIADASASAEAKVRQVSSNQFWGSAGGGWFNDGRHEYSPDPVTAAAKAALEGLFRL